MTKEEKMEWSATEIFHIKTKKSLVNKIAMFLSHKASKHL